VISFIDLLQGCRVGFFFFLASEFLSEQVRVGWQAKSLLRPLATDGRKRSRGVKVGEEKTKLFIFLSFLHMGPSYFCYCRSTSTQEPPVVI
jgi:hypothetical protein